MLAFREGPSIVKVLTELDTEPDLLMFDGSGRIHYRQAGIATQIGVIFDKPSIGVAKNLLCGERSNRKTMREGEKQPILSDQQMNLREGKKIGYAYQSRQYSSGKRTINPLYISPGHKVDEEKSVELVAKYRDIYKLPEPIRKADKKATEAKNGYQ